MIILGIDTSCDDTCCGIVEVKNKKFEILANIVSSQEALHQKFGGVFPSLAKREHQRNLLFTLKFALKKAKLLKESRNEVKVSLNYLKRIVQEEKFAKSFLVFLKKYQFKRIDLIAVTQGPGLEPCLWVGINFAKVISKIFKIPLIAVNHLESHILVNFSETTQGMVKKVFPALCLVVSGGHTLLFLAEKIGKYKKIGETRDDAAGECFDKTGRILGLAYPGGPKIEKLAEKARGKYKIILPRPMIGQKNFDFSFSGLKTAVLYKFQKEKKDDKDYLADFAKEIQEAILEVLVKKTLDSAKRFSAKAVIVGGGVSANKELKRKFKNKIKKEKLDLIFLSPKKQLARDNGVMVALAGYFKYKILKEKAFSKRILAKGNLEVISYEKNYS